MAESTQKQRVNWKAFECAADKMVRVRFGPAEVNVAPPTAEAWKALEYVFGSHRYRIGADDTYGYNCRTITGGVGKSLHSYGIAIDVNPASNPFRETPDKRPTRFSSAPTQQARAREVALKAADTDMTEAMIADVVAIRTKAGLKVFEWGGNWSGRKDAMHFEIDVKPGDLDAGIDWSTVRGFTEGADAVLLAHDGEDAALPQPVAGEDAFTMCHAVVEKWEGKFVNDPDDPGGATNMGITLATLRAWRNAPVSVDDVRHLGRAEALEIFRAKYWNKIDGDELPLAIAQVCYDAAVLSGPGRAVRQLQQALNGLGRNVEVDGDMGPLTISACRISDERQLAAGLADIRESYLRGLGLFHKYGKGWMNRLNDVRKRAMAMVGVVAAAPSIVGPIVQPHVPEITPMPVQGKEQEIIDTLRKLLELLGIIKTGEIAKKITPPTGESQAATELKEALGRIDELIKAMGAATGTKPSLGPVNGALGTWLGNLLNGKKSGLGIVGALLTSLLGKVPDGSPLAQVIPFFTTASQLGLGGMAMPLFLAIAAWGFLGKMEKWQGGSKT